MLRFCVAFVSLVVSVCSAAGQWRYQDDVDKMTGELVSHAQLVSDNSLALGFPYAGRNHGTITVRKHPAYGVDVMVGVEKGQILCRASQGCAITVRFGNGKPQQFSVVEPADHSSELVFVQNVPRFLQAAKKHRKFLIQISMFQEGDQVLEFTSPVELVWK